MAAEFDRRMMGKLFRTTLSVSLGAAYKGFEMLATPAESLPKVVDEVKTLLTVPPCAGDDLQQKFEAMAGLWLAKGTTIVAECKTTGEKFTEGG
jgi:hypothetical protein